MEKPLIFTDERLRELHDAVKDAKINGGTVAVPAFELLALLPAKPAPAAIVQPVPVVPLPVKPTPVVVTPVPKNVA